MTPDSIEQFRMALIKAGLRPGGIFSDGRIRRCGTSEKPGSKDAWYVLHENAWTGVYGCWNTGVKGKWRPDQATIDPKERKRIAQQAREAAIMRQEEEVNRQVQAAQRAQEALEAAKDANYRNRYLRSKKVRPCAGMKADGQDLLLPVMDETGAVISFQRIAPDGAKRFLPDGRTKGGFFPIKGSGDPLFICEGVATGLSIHEASGGTVLCAFSASNLEPVARIVRSRYPERQIILVADNDRVTEKRTGRNPGVEAARRAVEAVGGYLVVPGPNGDANDFEQKAGLSALRRLLSYRTPCKSKGDDGESQNLE